MNRVLVVNDSRFESIVIKDILSTIGYIVEFSDENSAVTKVQSFCPNYIIANLTMRNVNGDQLISLIKMKYPEIKCLLSSNNPINIEQFQNNKIDAVFQTPIDKNELHQIIKNIAKKNGNDKVALDNNSENDKKSNNNDENRKNPENNNNIKFCPYCGSKLQDEQKQSFTFCPFCGKKI